MTKRGLGFLVFFALLLLMALATGSSEIFLVTFSTGLVLTFALVSAAAGVFVLRAHHSLSEGVAARGDVVRLGLYFMGWMPLPVIVRINLALPDEKEHRCATQLWGNRHKNFIYELTCPHRGVWTIGVRAVRCGDVFGFFTLPLPRSHFAAAFTPLTVYPVVHEIPGLPPPPLPTMEYSENNPVTADQGDSFADTRLYRDGDSLKRIHWKLSIRTQELHTRQYEMSVDRMVVIAIDTQAKPNEPRESALNYADMATESAAALTLYFAGGGHTVRLCPAGEPGGGTLLGTTGDFPAAHTMLASAPFDTPVSVAELVAQLTNDLPYFSGFHVIAHEPSPELIELLSRVTALRCRASIVYPDATGRAEACTVTPEGVRLIAIAKPQDITERLGGWV